MALSKEEQLQAVHALGIKRFDEIQTALCEERKQCLEDRRFATIAGAQYEGLFEEELNKPKLEFNKIALVLQKYNAEYRNNRITVNYKSKTGNENDELANSLTDLYRGSEQTSCAQEAYDNAFNEAMTGGIGAWRICADLEDDEDDENEAQHIEFEPIYDADTCVFFDLNAKRQDMSDARYAFVANKVSQEAFVEEYPEAKTSSVDTITSGSQYDYFTNDYVTLLEYYVVEHVKDTVVYFETADGAKENRRESELKEDDSIEKELTARGFKRVNFKKIKQRKIHKYILSGAECVEDCGYIAGCHIPIVMVYGNRSVIDGIERARGHVRYVKDAQRLINLNMSKLTEIAITSPIEKPIIAPEQIQGLDYYYTNDHINKYPFIFMNPLKDDQGNVISVGPLGYTKTPDIPPALAQLMQFVNNDLQDIMGNLNAGEKIVSNISGEAIERIQNAISLNLFVYLDNMAKAMKWSGQIFMGMAREIFVEQGRKVKGVSEDGTLSEIELQKPIIGKDGETEYANDFSKANFEVISTVGASSESKRQSMRRDLIAMMQYIQDPDAVMVLTAQILANLDGENMQDVNDYFRQRLLQVGAVNPTEEERQQMQEAAQNQQPDPNQKLIESNARMMDAQSAKLEADTRLSEAKVQETLAKTAKTASDTDISQANAVMGAIDKAQAVNAQPQQMGNNTQGA